MLIRFAYYKLQRPRGDYFTPGTAITTYIQSADVDIQPLGAAGTTALSTIIEEKSKQTKYFIAKPFSAVHAALTAVTSTSDSVNLI